MALLPLNNDPHTLRPKLYPSRPSTIASQESTNHTSRQPNHNLLIHTPRRNHINQPSLDLVSTRPTPLRRSRRCNHRPPPAHTSHKMFMRLNRLYASTVLEVPDTHGTVVGSREEIFPVRVETEGADPVVVADLREEMGLE